jgi:signal transduction histidine kinase
MNEHNGHLIADDQVSPISSMTVGEAMDILRSNLMDIRERVARLTDDNDWGKCETIEPQKFIEEYENKHMSSSFRFEHLWEPFETNSFTKDVFDRQTGKLLFHKGDSINAAWFPRKALMQVFDNIVTNAREHGFTDSNRKDYTIRTSWDTDGLNMLIKISNNGAPLHADVNENLVLEYGYSTALNHNGHGGIGGGEIAEIMRKFGGNVSVISSPDKAFTVTYVLTMPLASVY